MVVVVELFTDTKFPMCENEIVDVFSIVAKASLALASTSREGNFLYVSRGKRPILRHLSCLFYMKSWYTVPCYQGD